MLSASREGSCEKLQTVIRTFANISTNVLSATSSKECSKVSCPTAVPVPGRLACKGCIGAAYPFVTCWGSEGQLASLHAAQLEA